MLLLILAIAACGHSQKTDAPYLQAPIRLQLSLLDGGELNLSRYRGQFVVLHLFTTWSIASQQDVERLKKLAALPNAPAIVGIALDLDGYRLVSPWRNAMDIRYTVTLADEDIQNGRSVLGRIKQVPTTIVLDRTGRRTRTFVGPLSDRDIAQIRNEIN